MSISIPLGVRALSEEISRAGGKAFAVGGYVRDSLIGTQSKDIDIEVFGLRENELVSCLNLSPEVGKSFPVWKLKRDGLEIDISLPRRERKTGKGHTGFECQPDPFMSIEEAAKRRDFTINSISYSISEEMLVDPFTGYQDLRKQILRITSPNVFHEDPLRVLRGMQFCSRLNLSATTATLEACKESFPAYTELSKERIFSEWAKWARGRKPSRGLEFLMGSGWLAHYPELQSLEETHQNPRWHGEGTVWKHTLLVTNAMASILGEEHIIGDDQTVLMLAALCHDMGKPEATHFGTSKPNIPAHWRSPGHAKNISWAIRFLDRVGISLEINSELLQRIIPLCKEHMVHLDTVPSTAQARRLSVRLKPENIRNLLILAKADRLGSICAESSPRFEEQLLQAAQQAEALDAAPKPILMGRHLMDTELMNGAPIKPGKEMGKILKKAFEAQLEGVFTDLKGAIEWTRSGL